MDYILTCLHAVIKDLYCYVFLSNSSLMILYRKWGLASNAAQQAFIALCPICTSYIILAIS